MSLNRHSMLILMLAGSVGLPYLTSGDGGAKGSRGNSVAQADQSGLGSSGTISNSGTHASPSGTSPVDSTGYGSAYSSSKSSSGPAESSAATGSYDAGSSARTSSPVQAQTISTTASAVGTGSTAAGGSGLSGSTDAGHPSGATGAGGPATSGADNPRDAIPPSALADVLRFDVTVPWIIEHWPRVSAGLSELDLHGYRVPLITGTNESDLAGSLTYYFNKKQQLDRIIFHGTSGDPRPLVTYVTNHFELKRVIVPDAGLAFYQRKSWGRSQSELLIRPARVLRSDIPNKRYEIEMALKRP